MLLSIALVMAGCGEKETKIVHTWTNAPTVEDVAAALTKQVYVIDNLRIDSMPLWKRLGVTYQWRNQVYTVSGEWTRSEIRIDTITWKDTINIGGVYGSIIETSATPPAYFTRREADSALCSQLQAKIDSMGCK